MSGRSRPVEVVITAQVQEISDPVQVRAWWDAVRQACRLALAYHGDSVAGGSEAEEKSREKAAIEVVE